MNTPGINQRHAFEQYDNASAVPGTGQVYEVFSDYLGSIIAVVEPATGQIVSQYEYDSFGNRTVVREGTYVGYGYTGQRYDNKIGLGYFRARYYDPEEGRFLSRDPMGFPDGHFNPYAYVANAPYQHIDPLGLAITTPFVVNTDEKKSNDIFAAVITGAATSRLLNAFSEASVQLTALGGSQFSLGDVRVGGNAGRGDPEGFGRLNRRCAATHPSGVRIAVSDRDAERRHGGALHNAIIAARVRLLLSNRAERLIKIGSVRLPVVNRNQMNAGGFVVSNCKPDIQYNWAGGNNQQLEEVSVTSPMYRELGKAIVMLTADPDAGWVLIRQVRR